MVCFFQEFSLKFSHNRDLQHPNIVQCLGLYRDNEENDYIVMELMTCGSVRDLFSADKKLTMFELLSM